MKRQNWLDGIIGFLAVASIVIIIIESLVELSQGLLVGLYVVDFLICLVFAGDFALRFRLAKDRGDFMKRNGYEILAMIPAVALYALGSLSVLSAALRSLRLVRVVRIVMVVIRLRRFTRVSGRFVRRSGLIYLLVLTISIIFIGGYAALILDQETPNPQITNFSDAVWWSISTVTTVGYGDIVPSSVPGRIMGMALMIIGIGIMTAFISQISATIVESRLRGISDKDSLKRTVTSEIKNRIDNIEKLSEDEIALLLQMIKALRQTKAE